VPAEHRLAVRVLAYTGCRVSELLSIKATDIDWLYGDIKLPALKAQGRVPFKMVVLLDPQAWAILKSHYEGKKGPIFPYSRQRLWQIVKEAGEKAGIRGVHPHTLRHSFGVNFTRAGGDTKVLQRIFGHKDVRTTINKYLKYQTSDMAEEGQKLTQRLKDIRNKGG
jgi:integrase/recombinase XerD